MTIRNPVALLVLGPFVAFFATGYFSGFGAVTAEIFPTAIRASAQGFTYNIGRVASAVAPWAVGTLAQSQGYGAALSLSSAAFLARRLRLDLDPGNEGPRTGVRAVPGHYGIHPKPRAVSVDTIYDGRRSQTGAKGIESL